MPADSSRPGPEQQRRPFRAGPAMRAAAAIVMAQGAALTLGSLAYGGWAVATRPRHLGLAVGAAVLGLLFGLALVAGGRGLVRGARPAVSPIVFVELILLPIAWSMGQARQWTICAGLAVPALVVLGLVFSPEGRGVLRGDRYPGPPA